MKLWHVLSNLWWMMLGRMDKVVTDPYDWERSYILKTRHHDHSYRSVVSSNGVISTGVVYRNNLCLVLKRYKDTPDSVILQQLSDLICKLVEIEQHGVPGRYAVHTSFGIKGKEVFSELDHDTAVNIVQLLQSTVQDHKYTVKQEQAAAV